jgi:hypothetical protein
VGKQRERSKRDDRDDLGVDDDRRCNKYQMALKSDPLRMAVSTRQNCIQGRAKISRKNPTKYRDDSLKVSLIHIARSSEMR